MSDQYGGPDDPTRAHRPFDDEEPTRLDQPVPPYDTDREPSSFTQPSPYAPPGGEEPRDPGIIAPLVTVALLAILIGMGIGYLLFHNSSSTTPTTTTTTTALTTTTTAAPETSTTVSRSTTTAGHATTTVGRGSTTTSTTKSSTSSSTTAKTSTTTA